MSNNYVNPWSPFDPEWYEEVFDKYLSTARYHELQQEIIDSGFNIPDSDGSRSSGIYTNATLNNSFNPEAAADTLKEIYDNSTHVLKARNHDNVHFYKWEGYMQDMIIEENTYTAEFTLYTNNIIPPNDRNKFKVSQFFRRWLTIEDLMNNWNIIGWNILLFIDSRVYSEYTIRIDDHETIVNFKYYPFWLKENYSVGFYKFDTNYQQRVLISSELCDNQWDWKMPISYIDTTTFNTDRVMVAINKISDLTYRSDDGIDVDVLGRNLEFLKIENGYLDLSIISDMNKALIRSETKEYLWLSIMYPKFLHEYPILLPLDSVYQSYMMDAGDVFTYNQDNVEYAYASDTGELLNVYVDKRSDSSINDGTWAKVMRPIVLSDAFINYDLNIYTDIEDDVMNIRKLAVKAADINLEFRQYCQLKIKSNDEFNSLLNKFVSAFTELHSAYVNVLVAKNILTNSEYSDLFFNSFTPMIDQISLDGYTSSILKDSKFNNDAIWHVTSPLIYKATELLEMFYSVDMIASMKRTILWEKIDTYEGMVRFQRPIDVSDFWLFEYNSVWDTWAPALYNIEYKFPDIYLISNFDGTPVSDNIILKAFFFYSDTQSVLNEARDKDTPGVDWSDDVNKYTISPNAYYRDMYIEKFFWMGINTVYEGVSISNSKWELLEYVMDNDSFKRFSDLFMNTIDQYFKYNMASYFNGDNMEFHFDELIDKIKETSSIDWNGYKKIENYARYLDKSWSPSFFDNMINIDNDWTPDESNIVYRPNASVDVQTIVEVIEYIVNNIKMAYDSIMNNVAIFYVPMKVEAYPPEISFNECVTEVLVEFYKNKFMTSTSSGNDNCNGYEFDDLTELIAHLKVEPYNLNVDKIIELDYRINELINYVLLEISSFTTTIDIDILCNDDLIYLMNAIKSYCEYIMEMRDLFEAINSDAKDNMIYDMKLDTLEQITADIIPSLQVQLKQAMLYINDFDINIFMDITNNISTLDMYGKYNDNDDSLIYHFNKFESTWPQYIKDIRNKMFLSTVDLLGMFEPSHSYSSDEIEEFSDTIVIIDSSLRSMRDSVIAWWDAKEETYDEELLSKFDQSISYVESFLIILSMYIECRSYIISLIDSIRLLLDSIRSTDKIGDTEIAWIDTIFESLDDIILSISYIASSADEALLNDSISNIINIISNWIDNFIPIEESVFDFILGITSDPNSFIEITESQVDLINALILYLETITREYIPDSSTPTYGEVFSVTSIEIEHCGFWYKTGDVVFASGLHSYIVDELTGDLDGVSGLSSLAEYRCTTYRNPMVQQQSYLTSSSGTSLGLTLIPTAVDRHLIISDDLASSVVTRIKYLHTAISNILKTDNHMSNSAITTVLDSIASIDSSWNNLLSSAGSFISDTVKSDVGKAIIEMNDMIDPLNALFDARLKIEFIRISDMLNEIISNIVTAGISDNVYDANIQLIRTKATELTTFTGNDGSMWTDAILLQPYISGMQDCILYLNNMIDDVSSIDDIDNLRLQLETYLSIISSTNSAISNIDTFSNNVSNANLKLNNTINDVYIDSDIDPWYIMTSYISIAGTGYVSGDIVEISYKNDIYDEKLLFQINEVNMDKVLSVYPFMNYALPYSVYGTFSCNTCTGKGSGLKINIDSRRITSDDNSLIYHEDSYNDIDTEFDDNDNLLFRFSNIHDLDMNYHVFSGGIQNTRFISRHSDIELTDGVNIKGDFIYISANSIAGLKNSSITVSGEHYFVYKITGVELLDKGAGYSEGQSIYFGTDDAMIKFNVVSISEDPYGSIETISLANGNSIDSDFDSMHIDSAEFINDGIKNIDDEYSTTLYGLIDSNGVIKKITHDYPDEYLFMRYDELDDGNMNDHYLYPRVTDANAGDYTSIWDIDNYTLLGSRIDNVQIGITDDKWNGIKTLNPPTDPFIPDVLRQPTSNNYYKDALNDWQFIDRIHIHSYKTNNKAYDIEVNSYNDLPKNTTDYPDGKIGIIVKVIKDETQNNHATLYRIRTFISNGSFIYDTPEYCDDSWNAFDVNWMNIDHSPLIPSMKKQYMDAGWTDSDKTYADIIDQISDNMYQRDNYPSNERLKTYIHDITVMNLAVFNWTLKKWETLSDTSKWHIYVYDVTNWGFTLTYTGDGDYSYDMKLYILKNPLTQNRNASLVRNAVANISVDMSDEIYSESIRYSVNVSRNLLIRKLFPYYQKNSYVLNNNDKTINCSISSYMHFRNEIHLEDIKLFNVTANRYENILDRSMFDVNIKNDNMCDAYTERQINITSTAISSSGVNFVNGIVWGYNMDLGIHVFGEVQADMDNGGFITSFNITHCPNPPDYSISLEFDVYQSDSHTTSQKAVVIVTFEEQDVYINGDGYINDVTNKMSVVSGEFQIVVKYELLNDYEYDVIIDKTTSTTEYFNEEWVVKPVIELDGVNVPASRIVCNTSSGRVPLVNPENKKPSLIVTEHESGTSVQYNALYKAYETLTVITLPYPVRSVYVQRDISDDGYVNVGGSINKPLNKKYHEFWVNGKLLSDEVTIISPTKFIMHGLTSLKNLEIIEINRDSNEWFSDTFLDVYTNIYGRLSHRWDMQTYIDDALECKLVDNYTEAEQASLLYPVWPQVDVSDENFKSYPMNSNIDQDMLEIIDIEKDIDILGLDELSYEYLVINIPTINGFSMTGNSIEFAHMGFEPIPDERIIELIQEEWEDIIADDPYFDDPLIMNEENWYGKVVRMYDGYGIRVNVLDDSYYHVADSNLIQINTTDKTTTIIKSSTVYDLD